MVKLAGITASDVTYEPGVGDARITIAAVRAGARRAVGIDLDPVRVEESRANVKAAGLSDKIDIRLGDALEQPDLGQMTVVLLYMGDHFNMLIRPYLWKQLPVGARVVSHRFLMGDDWPPDKTVTVKDEYGLPLRRAPLDDHRGAQAGEVKAGKCGWLATRSSNHPAVHLRWPDCQPATVDTLRVNQSEGWRRRPDLNRGWRFCRPGKPHFRDRCESTTCGFTEGNLPFFTVRGLRGLRGLSLAIGTIQGQGQRNRATCYPSSSAARLIPEHRLSAPAAADSLRGNLLAEGRRIDQATKAEEARVAAQGRDSWRQSRVSAEGITAPSTQRPGNLPARVGARAGPRRSAGSLAAC